MIKISKKIAVVVGILLVILGNAPSCVSSSNDVQEAQSRPPVNTIQPALSPDPTLTATRTDLSETTTIATEPPPTSTVVPLATPGLSETTAIAPYPYPPPPVATTSLNETTAIDSFNPSALIRVPFVRDGSIYLYEDGEEKLVAQPVQQTTQQACFNLIYPFLSPNGQYLAYIEQVGTQPDFPGACLIGFLRIVDTATGINQPTSYKINHFSWTPANLLNFTPEREIAPTPQPYTIRNIYFDPSNQQETVFETVIDQDASTSAETMLSADYPTDDLHKLIRYKDNQYYLVDQTTNAETLLFDSSQAVSFLDWSPNGRYAIFESALPTDGPEAIGFVVDTQSPGATPQEMTVSSRIGAGGPPSTGRKWYFEQGFVEYCREHLYFVDGSEPLQLTDDEEKGGCHNEEGFVATSPGGEYAFVKFKDRFELHTKDGTKTVIEETEPLVKNRSAPANLIWVNDDYLIIFETTENYSDEPTVHLFDRPANTIKPLIQNAYLIE